MTCSVEGCANRHLARGLCSRHYQRMTRHGSPTDGQRDRPKLSAVDRFWSKVNRSAMCWEWAGTMNDQGYGMFRHDSKNERAHRYVWKLLIGEIPEGGQIDHRCRNRACVNPDHLRLATNKQNAEHVGPRSNNTSGYRGVTFNKRRNKWSVLVGHGGRNYSGGYFTDVHEAGAAAKALRNELFTHNDLDRRTA